MGHGRAWRAAARGARFRTSQRPYCHKVGRWQPKGAPLARFSRDRHEPPTCQRAWCYQVGTPEQEQKATKTKKTQTRKRKHPWLGGQANMQAREAGGGGGQAGRRTGGQADGRDGRTRGRAGRRAERPSGHADGRACGTAERTRGRTGEQAKRPHGHADARTRGLPHAAHTEAPNRGRADTRTRGHARQAASMASVASVPCPKEVDLPHMIMKKKRNKQQATQNQKQSGRVTGRLSARMVWSCRHAPESTSERKHKQKTCQSHMAERADEERAGAAGPTHETARVTRSHSCILSLDGVRALSSFHHLGYSDDPNGDVLR